MSGFELTFNWFYADSKHIAMYSSGRLPLRAAGVDPGLPTNGNGSYEWRGFLAPSGHPQTIDPKSGAIVNWNNKPAAGFPAADDNWTYGSVQRVQLLDAGIAAKKTHTPTSVVAAMNAAATKDLRWTLVPLLADVLANGTPPSARDNQMLSLLGEWDGSRLDANLDGKIDAPGAAIMDAWWPKLAVAVLQPVLGPLTTQLAQLEPDQRRREPGRQLVRRGVVRVRRQGPARAARQARGGEVLDRVLRRREQTACAASLWAVARRRRATRSRRRRARTRPTGAATRPPSGSSSPASSPTRCAGRTGRRSSRS